MVRFVLLRLVFILGWICLGAEGPDALYLTWVDDPTTTMTVVWQGGESSRVLYHLAGNDKWMSVEASVRPVPDTKVIVYVSQIEGLKSDSTYVFKIEGCEREFKFRTLPQKLSREVRFVVGGDIFYYWGAEILNRMNHAISYDDPDFVVMGGDLAYTAGAKSLTRGRKSEMARWQEFFRVMQKSLMGKDSRVIPMVPVIGNHDVHRMSAKRKYPELFYSIFPFPEEGKAYRNLKIGSYLNLVLLDSGHSSPIGGEQAQWLQSVLSEDASRYLFAIYHVGAYPSVYKYRGEVPELLRKTWVPLFEEAHISGAFEHHSHALKRTYPIKKGQIDPDGVVYYGDGSWGVPPRCVHTPQELWYLAMAEPVNACWFIHLTKKEAVIEARTPEGVIKDTRWVAPRESVK